jgi:ATP-dependent exoDNAse (exonuclease V), alpha subunit - helicase superfamily I member
VLAAAVLAAHAVTQGHAGLRLDQAARLLPEAASAEEGAAAVPLPWPALAQWTQALQASPWVYREGALLQAAPAPAVLVLEAGLVYLRRYREFERRLAVGLQRIGSQPVETGQLAAIAPVFASLFPQAAGDHQAQAAAMALRHPLMLVTGGPGTGKTTTIARLLVLLAAQARAAGQPAPRIGLAAPTGRAAERMAESLRLAAQKMLAAGVDPALLAALPAHASTVHRLLGVIPDSPEFRHHADNPLALEVLVVDEASMMGLSLMTRLVEAVASGTRLILLGDPDQLPSVEAGDVLAALLRASGDGSSIEPDDATALQPLLGTLPAVPRQAPASGFAGRRVQLQRGWRQSQALDLAPLAAACRQGDAAAALALLRGGALAGCTGTRTRATPWPSAARRCWPMPTACAMRPTRPRRWRWPMNCACLPPCAKARRARPP